MKFLLDLSGKEGVEAIRDSPPTKNHTIIHQHRILILLIVHNILF